MSNIFAPSELPDHTSIDCPECGALKGTTCANPPNHWNHGIRIKLIQFIFRLKELKQPEPPSGSSAPKDSYAEGWNDAIDAIIDNLIGFK